MCICVFFIYLFLTLVTVLKTFHAVLPPPRWASCQGVLLVSRWQSWIFTSPSVDCSPVDELEQWLEVGWDGMLRLSGGKPAAAAVSWSIGWCWLTSGVSAPETALPAFDLTHPHLIIACWDLQILMHRCQVCCMTDRWPVDETLTWRAVVRWTSA